MAGTDLALGGVVLHVSDGSPEKRVLMTPTITLEFPPDFDLSRVESITFGYEVKYREDASDADESQGTA